MGRLATGFVLTALLVACGADGDEPGGEKAAYIQQSDAICRETFPKTSALTARDQATAEKANQEWAAAAERLKAIPIPNESIELAHQFVVGVENISLSYLAAARSLAGNDQADADRDLNDAAESKRKAAEVAEEYGYDDCRGIATA